MRVIIIRDNEIINVAYPFPINNPSEGLQENGDYVVYVEDLEGLEPHEFIEQRYWNGTSLQARPSSPSAWCRWNGTAWYVDEENYIREIRNQRAMLLFKSDWTQIADAPLTPEQVAESITYRQALRDITNPILANPQSYITIEDAPWPTPPQFLA